MATAPLAVIVLKGGLGNQMFQYALGETLRIKYSTNCIYVYKSSSGFRLEKLKHSTRRAFELHNFPLVSMRNIVRLPDNISLDDYKNILLHLKIPHTATLYKDNLITSPNLAEIQKHQALIFDGYWQDFRMFEDLNEHIFKIFSNSINSHIKEHKNREVTNTQSDGTLALHVRRGDFLADKKRENFHGVCSIEYFQKSLEFALASRSFENVYCFSDDYAWVKSNLTSMPLIFVDRPWLSRPSTVLGLMSSCSDIITSNSSLSWWAAFLISYRSRGRAIVQIPSPWLRGVPGKVSMKMDGWVERHSETGNIL